jgi:hypothetical protein
VRGRTIAARRHGHLSRIALGIGNELRKRFRRHRRVHHHGIGLAGEQRDRCNVVHKVELEICVKRRIDEIGRCGEQQRVTVGGRVRDRFGRNIGAGACTVFDDGSKPATWVTE